MIMIKISQFCALNEANECLSTSCPLPSWLVLVNVGFPQLWPSVYWWHLLGWIHQPKGKTKPKGGWKKDKTSTVSFRAQREESSQHLHLCLKNSSHHPPWAPTPLPHLPLSPTARLWEASPDMPHSTELGPPSLLCPIAFSPLHSTF